MYLSKLVDGMAYPVVYFVQAGVNGPIKIGWSYDLQKRITSMQVSHYEKLHLRGVIENANPSTESEVHSKLAKYRIRGEWFWPADEVRDEMYFYAWPRFVPVPMEEGERF